MTFSFYVFSFMDHANSSPKCFIVLHFKFKSICFWVGFPKWLSGKETACQAGDQGSIPESDPWVGKIPWRRKWQPTPVFLPGGILKTEKLVGLQSTEMQGVTYVLATQQQQFFRVNFLCKI